MSEVDPLTWIEGVTGFIGLAVALGLWWTYFDMVGMRRPIATMRGGVNWRVFHLPLTVSIAAAGAAMISLIEHATDPATPAETSWLLSGAVAVAVVSLAAFTRQLADYHRFIEVFRPAVRLALVIALVALGVGALQPPPVALVVVLFALMTIQWMFAIYHWTATEEGIAHLAEIQEEAT